MIENETEVPTAKRRWPLRVAKWTLGIIAAIVLLIVAGIALLDSSAGKRFIIDQVEQIEAESGLRIGIGRIEGSIYSEATLHDVTVADPKGVFLRIPELELDWRPLSWLSSGLDIRSAVARRGNLLRLPEFNETQSEGGFLPDFDIRLDRLELVDFTVARGIAGDEARRVNLVSRVRTESGKLYLLADGRLGGEDRLYALIDLDEEADKFDAKIDYRAPAGGLLAGLLGADEDYEASLIGDGSWSAWDGGLLVRRAGEQVAAFKLTANDGTYGILGTADPSPVLAGLPLDALGRKMALFARGTFAENVIDGRFSLAGAAVRANGAGGIDLGNNALQDFDLKARLTEPALFGPDLTLQGATIAAELDGPMSDLTVAHVINVDRFAAGTTQLAGLVQRGTATWDGTRFVLPLDADVARVVSGNAMVDPRLTNGTLGGTIVYSGDRLVSDDLAVAFPGLDARLSLRGDLANGVYALAGPVNAERLLLEDLGEVDVAAKILFRMGSNVPWTLQANLAGRMPRVTNATLADLAGNNIRFKGGVTLGANRPIAFQDASLNASKLALTLNGKVDGGRTSLAGRGRHTEYGPFTVQATIAGDGPRAELVFADPLPAAGLKDVRVALAPIDDGFAIETAGQSLLGPFDGTINLFSSPGGPTRLAIERLDIWRTSVTGDITLGDAANGTLTLAGGGLDGTIQLAPRGGGQGFDVDLAARNATFAGATPIAIREADIDVSGLLVDGNSTIEGNVRAAGISYGNVFVGRLVANSSLRNGTGRFNAAIAGRRGSRFDLQLTGDIAPDRIAAVARGNYGGRKIEMPRRAVLTRSGDGWQLAPTQLNFGSGRMVARGRFGGNGPVAANVQLARMPLSAIDVLGGELGLGGYVSGLIDVSAGPGGLPVGEARVQVKGLSRSGLVLTSRPVDLSMIAKLSTDRLVSRAVIVEEGERRGRLQARISNLPSSGDLIGRLNRGDLFAQLRFNGPADALWRLAAIDTFDLTGPLRVSADARGTLQNPRVAGSLASDDLRLRSALTGTDVRSIRARGNFSGSLLRLTSFRGEAPNGGTVSGSGTVDLSGLGPRGPQIDLRMAASNAQILNRPDMAATVTGPMRVVSNGVGGTIAGRLRVNRARWRLGAAEEAVELPNIRTREINLPPDIAPQASASAPWRYLIDARAPSRVEVRGMGLDSEWSADVLIRGTTDDPRIGGSAEVIRGGYSFAGTRFELTRGEIDFDENVPIDPRVNILAETDVTGLSVSVSVTGNATQPEIAFNSVPALPEEEILSRLLFGGSISNLSATDALQLGSALASLRGGGGMDPINKLRTSIGLDRLRIVPADPALDRGTSVALGKNFGRRFYAEIITDGAGYSATDVEFRVTSWLTLLASISTIGRESVAAEYSRDY